MKSWKLMSGIFILFFTIAQLQAQQLAQLHVVGKAEKSQDEFVGSNHRDANGRVCAAIEVISDMVGFSYDAYNGVVGKVDHKPGQDIVYLQPDERVLEIFHEGYEPLRLILPNYGIHLAPRQVWKIKISGVGKAANTLPVTFLVQPKDATIEVDGVSASSGKPIDLSSGRHQLKISKKGYRTVNKEINVDKQHVLFNFTLQEVELQAVTIKSVPPGAAIFLNEVKQGQTDKGLWLYPGEYRLKLNLPGYVEVEQTINVAENQDNMFAFTLLKNAGYLQVTLYPPDATITINQQTYRATNKISLQPGTYQVVVSKDGYLDVKDQVQIKIGETVQRTYRLIKNTGMLRLDVQPVSATVLINKADYSRRPAVELAPGTYKIEVLAKGYYPKSETITVGRGQTLSRSYRLVERVGKLRFSVSPVFADVQLKREGHLVKRWQGLKLLKDLPIGTYQIEASANGYSTEKKTITIEENKTTAVDLTLEKGVFFTGAHRTSKATGQLRLTVTPNDAQTTIDGTPVTDRYLILPVGKYRIDCQKSGFKGQSRSFEINRNQETKLEIHLTQKSRGKAFTRSLFFPGWGQSYKENHARGWLYRLAFIGSAASAYYFTDQYNKNVKDYNALHDQYEAAVDYQKVLSLGTQMEKKYQTVQDNEKLRNYFYMATAGVWFINVLDALIMPAGWRTSGKYSLRMTGQGVQLAVPLP